MNQQYFQTNFIGSSDSNDLSRQKRAQLDINGRNRFHDVPMVHLPFAGAKVNEDLKKFTNWTLKRGWIFKRTKFGSKRRSLLKQTSPGSMKCEPLTTYEQVNSETTGSAELDLKTSVIFLEDYHKKNLIFGMEFLQISRCLVGSESTRNGQTSSIIQVPSPWTSCRKICTWTNP